LIDAFAIDAALLDLDLGDGDGATVAEMLRAKRGDLPLAFFSSETIGPMFSRATALATVFSKESPDAAIAWAIEATRPA
jgi:CheY-like chemotaxis protein